MMESFTTVVDALSHWGNKNGNNPAFIFRDRTGGRRVLSWEDLYQLAGCWAARLKADGLGRGRLIMNTLPNSPERVVCEAGTLLCGAATVNGQSQLADGSDLISALRQSHAAAIFVDPVSTSNIWSVLEKHILLEDDHCVTSEELPDLRHVYRIQRTMENGFLTQLESSNESFQAMDVKAEDICTVFTTSGSTGFSKLVVFTHGSFVAGVTEFIAAKDRSTDPQFNLAPLGWGGGHAGLTFIEGGTRILCDMMCGRPEDVADFIWRAIQEERCPSAVIPPVYFLQILERVKEAKHELYRNVDWLLDTVILAGQPITSSMIQAIGVLCRSILILYGSTECPMMSSLRLTDSSAFEDFDSGTLTCTVQLKIVDVKEETVQPPGVLGNILAKSPFMMKEYLNDPESTAAAFTQDGFFRTGDIGKMTSEGHLIVMGRGSDAIMRGAYIFYPGWLEMRIRACPQVVNVLVVGVPDPFLQEELCACLVLASSNATVDEVREFVNKDILSLEDDPLSPRPRYYLKFESFPLNTSGKINRSEVKKLALLHLKS